MTALAARLRQVTVDLSIQKQRLHSTGEPIALESLKAAIAFFNRQTKELAAEIAALVTVDPIWAALDKTIRSIKGLSDRTVAVLLADLSPQPFQRSFGSSEPWAAPPEIGAISNKAIAKLVGFAPIANDSGKRNGRRPVRGGSDSVRSILFLVADLARKCDDDLANFRNRLIAQGKEKMVVRIALARKLLVRLNAKARQTRNRLAHAA